jgi:hypothetical protein
MTPERIAAEGNRWAHEQVEEVGDQEPGWPGGDMQRYRCLDCGTEWTQELPQ